MRDLSNRHGEIALVAGRQWGRITRDQLLTPGMASSTAGHRVEAGRLIQVHLGVHAVGYRRREPVACATAAVLACAPGTILSHDSALALWDLRRWPRAPEVIAPRCVRGRGSGPTARPPCIAGRSPPSMGSPSPAPPGRCSTFVGGPPTASSPGYTERLNHTLTAAEAPRPRRILVRRRSGKGLLPCSYAPLGEL